MLSAKARELGDRIQVWGGQNLLLETVRSLVRVGRAAEALAFCDRLRTMSRTSIPARAFLTWAEGLLEPDAATAREILAGAVRAFEALERRVEVGRCLIDVAHAEQRLGDDPAPTLARARKTLEGCGATLFVRELGAARATAQSG